MTIYIIQGNDIAAHSKAPDKLAANAVPIRSIKDLDPDRFPDDRLIELWNALPGAKPVRAFPTRKDALTKLWAGMTKLSASPRKVSKQQQVIDLLGRDRGATVEEIVGLTGWQPHTVRGTISGTLKKRLGLKIASKPESRGRVYRIAGAGKARGSK